MNKINPEQVQRFSELTKKDLGKDYRCSCNYKKGVSNPFRISLASKYSYVESRHYFHFFFLPFFCNAPPPPPLAEVVTKQWD